eukprot:m.23636 g.23636  ORF g.23636 m.23636 type:complete len:59 (+) comp9527_c0_seq4:83-259(+)
MYHKYKGHFTQTKDTGRDTTGATKQGQSKEANMKMNKSQFTSSEQGKGHAGLKKEDAT